MRKRGFDFPRGKTLEEAKNIHIVVYVPSTRFDKPILGKEFKKRVSETRRFLRNNLGGSTTVSGVGDWIDDDKKIYTESVAKVESFSKSVAYDKVDLKIRKWLLNKKKQWRQKYLSYEFEEKLIFI